VLLLAALLSLQHADTAAVGAMATPFEQAFGIGNAQLGTRLLLGIVTAPAGSAVASLAGDVFPAEERSRIYGWVLSGELLGAGAALLVAADLGRALGWSATFLFLAVFSTAIAALLYFFLIEPDRRAAWTAKPSPAAKPDPALLFAPGIALASVAMPCRCSWSPLPS
jgi:predicted MFS family arabinose efflux permease